MCPMLPCRFPIPTGFVVTLAGISEEAASAVPDLTEGCHEATRDRPQRPSHRRRGLGPPPLRRPHPAALHEVGVVAGAVGQRDEGVEEAAVPIDGADEMDVGDDLAWLHDTPR